MNKSNIFITRTTFFNEKTCILKDLFKNYHYPYEKIIFKNDKKLFSKHLIIGYNIENELICDWDLTGKEHERIRNYYKKKLIFFILYYNNIKNGKTTYKNGKTTKSNKRRMD